MNIRKLLDDLAVISKLGDYPATDDNLSTDEFKAKFDAAPLAVQEYINDTLIPDILKSLTENQVLSAEKPTGPALWFKIVEEVEGKYTKVVFTYVDSQQAEHPLSPSMDIDAIDGLRTALNEKAEKQKIFYAVIPGDSWSETFPYQQTVAVVGLLGTDHPDIDLDLTDDSDAAILSEAWARVGKIVANDGALVVYCYAEPPIVPLPVKMKVVR